MITTRAHGVMDYLLGAALIAAPWIFNFAAGGAETWVPVLVGAAIIAYSIITNYELGLVGLISMRNHLRIDIVAGIFLAASPWIFGFSGLVWAPHLIVGLLLVGSGTMTQVIPQRPALSGQGDARHHPHMRAHRRH
jgi:hypothetical protein